jgi:hypothetical protein
MYKAIYLDTNIFFDCKFNVLDGPLKELGKLAFKHGIELWSSDIALTELQIAIRDRISAVSTSFAKAKDVLRYSKGVMSLDKQVGDLAIQSAFAAVQQYFHAEEVRQLSVDDLDESDIAAVFSDYFNSKRCFSNERKRNEFPDAFQVAMILRAIRKGETVAVLSNDKDFASAFSGLEEVKVKSSIQQVLSDLKQSEDE